MFHALEGNGTPPYELTLNRVCEEFGCLPRQAHEELQNDPEKLALQVIRVRDFVKARASLRTYAHMKKLHPKSKIEKPSGKLYDLVEEFEFDDAADLLGD